jgi:acetylornithine deacetylase/succinyl-diaminopimelate desuccinylase-like protein
MTRQQAIETATALVSDGRFERDLAAAVAIPTESQNPDKSSELWRYLDQVLAPRFHDMGFATKTEPNPITGAGPLLIARRWESADLPTVFGYGHGDVVRGMAGDWSNGRDPWILQREGERLYGRGTADNKGQHVINMLALETVLAMRGRLGFNMIYLIETSEEIGSPGLREFCDRQRDNLAADVFFASDGPRVTVDTPTLCLGERGVISFSLEVKLRERAYHSGNWGGVLADPSVILAHAIASIISPDGRIQVAEWIPKEVPANVRTALCGCPTDVETADGGVNDWWGEPSLSAAEKLFAWTSFSVLAQRSGNPERPVNAIPPRAIARCGLRFIADIDQADLLPALRRHLDRHGLSSVDVVQGNEPPFAATRLDPAHPWVQWAKRSVEATIGRTPQILPSGAGSLPNDIFSEVLGLPTIWVPHSYNACGQHAPNEHLLLPLACEGLAMMTGLFWDLAEIEQRPSGSGEARICLPEMGA